MRSLIPIEAEQGLLASTFFDQSILDKITGEIMPRDFVHESHRKIFQAAIHLHSEGAGVNPFNIATKLGPELGAIGGLEYLEKLDVQISTSRDFEFFAKQVSEASRLRSLKATLENASTHIDSEMSVDEILRAVSGDVFKVCANKDESSLKTLHEVAEEAFDAIRAAYEGSGEVTGTSSGIADLDHKTTGFYPGDLLILAGRPGMGKTTLALNIARNIADQGKPVVMFSLEMPAEQLASKLLCDRAGVDVGSTRSGNLKTRDIERLVSARDQMRDTPFWIYDRPNVTTAEIQAILRQIEIVTGNPPGLIVIDYLQLMTGDRRRGQSREQEVSQISRELKIIARRSEAPVLALSQLNRGVEQRQDKRPMMSDLRESGAIEQDADAVMMVFRPGYYETEAPQDLAELIISKQRRGPTGTVLLRFDGAQSRFEPWIEESHHHFMNRSEFHGNH